VTVQLKHPLHPSLRHSIDSILFSFHRSDAISACIQPISPTHDSVLIHVHGTCRSQCSSLGHRVFSHSQCKSMSFFPRKKKHTPSNSAPATGLASLSQPGYPWFAHTPQLGHSSSPFPRYGHTLSTTATATGELFLFGGYAYDYSNDLYVFSTRDFSTTFLQTSGETPSPRYAHGAALTSTHLLVWGGLTKDRVPDDSLYLLNLGMSDLSCQDSLQLIRASCIPVSRKWTRVVVNGPGPGGRYFHTVTLVGSNLFVFGGWSGNDQSPLNDIWALDLDRCTFPPRFHEPFLQIFLQ